MSVIEAIQNGDMQGLLRLLAGDAALVNEKAPGGIPAVLFALYCRQPEAVQLLLDSGATVDFFIACGLGRTEDAASMLAESPGLLEQHSGDGWTGLHLASFFGRVETVRYLLQRGASPHAVSTNPMQNQPLHAAAAGRHPAIVKLLLQSGADPNATQSSGHRPLDSTRANGDTASTELLLAAGARP